MIDRIASAAAPLAPATPAVRGDDLGHALLDAVTGAGAGGPIGTPLRAIAASAASAIAGNADPVACARLESAVLDFAREAKAVAIGRLGEDPAAIRTTLDAALAGGAADAAALAPVGFDGVDHATSTFERAAARLAHG